MHGCWLKGGGAHCREPRAASRSRGQPPADSQQGKETPVCDTALLCAQDGSPCAPVISTEKAQLLLFIVF